MYFYLLFEIPQLVFSIMGNNEVYEIISSLSGAELKKFSKIVKENTHFETQKLFKLLLKQIHLGNIREQDLIKKLNSKYFTKRKFELKKSAYQFIIDIQQSKLNEWEKGLSICNFLFNKGLNESAFNKIIRLKQEVIQYEDNLFLLRILAKEKEIKLRLKGALDIHKINNIEREEIIALAQLKQISKEWKNLASIFYTHIKRLKIEELEFTINPKDLKIPIVFEALILKKKTKAIESYALKRDAHTAYSIYKNLLDKFEKEKDRIIRFPNHYFSTWSNYIICCGSLRKNNELEYSIYKMKNFIKKGVFKSIIGFEAKVELRIINERLNIISRYKTYDKDTEKYLEEVLTFLAKKQFKETDFRILIIYVLGASTAFILNNKKLLNQFLYGAFAHEKNKQVEDVVVAFKLLEIMQYFDEGDIEWVNVLYKKLNNFVRYRKAKHQFESVFFKMLNELLHIDTVTKSQQIQIFKKYKTQFDAFDDIPSHFARTRIADWVRAKAENKSLLAYIMEE